MNDGSIERPFFTHVQIRIHFDHFGQKFGAGDTYGSLSLWRFDAHIHSNKPYYVKEKKERTRTMSYTFILNRPLLAILKQPETLRSLTQVALLPQLELP